MKKIFIKRIAYFLIGALLATNALSYMFWKGHIQQAKACTVLLLDHSVVSCNKNIFSFTTKLFVDFDKEITYSTKKIGSGYLQAPYLKTNGTILLSGWAADPSEKKPSDVVFIKASYLDETLGYSIITPNTSRPDVADHLDVTSSDLYGWSTTLDTNLDNLDGVIIEGWGINMKTYIASPLINSSR